MAQQHLPSPWRASTGNLVMFLLISVILGVAIGLQDPVAGPLAAILVLLVTAGFELWAAFRVNRALSVFAQEIGEPGEPISTVHGEQGLRWPHRRIEVTGRTWRFTVRPLKVTVAEESWKVPARQARDGARKAITASMTGGR